MPNTAFALFDTDIGECGIAWTDKGIVGVQLPESRRGELVARFKKGHPDILERAPTAEVRRAMKSICTLIAGKATSLKDLGLDMSSVPPFHRKVYVASREILSGETITYGELAERLGSPGSARAVGQALGRNPFALVVPCHRVLAAGGKVGGFSAHGGVATKLRLLSIEGVAAKPNPSLFEGDGILAFDPRVAEANLSKADSALGRLIKRAGPYRMQLRSTPNIFVALAEAIVYQQLNGRAAATIYARVCALFPRAHEGPTAEGLLKLSDAKLRGAGLSGSKLLALRDLAQKSLDGVIPTLAEAHRMEDEALVERLTSVRGIGRWTVEMLLMSRLGRPDVLPLDDYGVRNGFGITFNKGEMPTKKELSARGEQWKPYRSVASWYLWRAVDLAKK